MNETISVGEAIARTLEQYQVNSIYGVISIHNLPIADAIGQRGQIHFVPARGEAGAVTMADAHSRFKGLGVALTSTGAGAGNAVGSMIEAMNANSPMIHITGQVEKPYLDMDAGFIHETRDQLGFLRSSSKQAYRVHTPEQAIAVLHKAIQEAQTPPCGPVSIEIPIDIQSAQVPISVLSEPVLPREPRAVDESIIERLAQQITQAKHPLLWIGGGTLGCEVSIRELADAGVTVISTTHARGVLADNHPRSLRAFHNSPSIESIIKQCDLTIVAGSRLRSNETRTWSLPLPTPLIQIDIDPQAANRNYIADWSITADCRTLLPQLAKRIHQLKSADLAIGEWEQEIKQAVNKAISSLREQCGAYALLNDAIEHTLPSNGIFVRDITVSGSLWGSRLLKAEVPLQNIHSLAGAIGMGLSMAIGTAVANPDRKVLGLVGDGGLMLGIGELATMAQEHLNLTLLIMNDSGYGVMRGIQEQYFNDRQYYNKLHTPSFAKIGEAMGIKSFLVDHQDNFLKALTEAIAYQGPSIIEVDMNSIGPLKFAGPPQKKLY